MVILFQLCKDGFRCVCMAGSFFVYVLTLGLISIVALAAFKVGCGSGCGAYYGLNMLGTGWEWPVSGCACQHCCVDYSIEY